MELCLFLVLFCNVMLSVLLFNFKKFKFAFLDLSMSMIGKSQNHVLN